MHTYSLKPGGSTEEGVSHPWVVKAGFWKVRHFSLAWKDKQDYERQNGGKYSREKEQHKPRQGALKTSGLLGHRGA